ncbi:MAG: 3'-5' exonuclease [Flavobacteriales bacterium]|nr:3'-5' exonuclease [Flavobacteriales bacterium]MCW8914021.1 3'-5' exonuclease [Flavobacteriales bacterium]MCW8938079.1 3'-5' exonuclease [Flavobacteriales bacterium]MCW8969403.1 3'-5' exonuclease [Flavobacteriales bacterium]MCW8991112.1 3'-5' exonuclease [Flavobacteriales bacterium]
MSLNLTKPLAFIDLETTGLNIASDRIVEISIVKVHPNGNKDIVTRRINPTIPISKESTSIHGISDDDVKNEPTFKQMAKELNAFVDGCDLAGFNSNKFDIPMLAEEFLRAEVDFDITKRKLVDVQNIFHKMEQRTLAAAYKFYCNKDLTNAHSAEADTIATMEILLAQVEKYDSLENNVAFLSEFSRANNNADLLGRIIYDENNIEVFNFGKHKGKSVLQVLEKEPGYYHWMMNGDFPLYTKKVLTQIRLKALNEK